MSKPDTRLAPIKPLAQRARRLLRDAEPLKRRIDKRFPGHDHAISSVKHLVGHAWYLADWLDEIKRIQGGGPIP